MPNPRRTVGGETREWDGSTWVPVSAPVDTSVPMYHPGANESPTSAAISELERTAGEAAAGLARSPWDLVKNTVGLVAHPLDAASGMVHSIAHPVDTIKALGDNPRAAGSLLGQLLLGKVGAPVISDAASAENLGGATRAVGNAMEAAGRSRLGRLAEYGGAYRALQGSPAGAAIAIAPTALKYGGRGLQSLGDTIEGLKAAAVEAPRPDVTLSGITLSPEAVARNIEATNLRDVEGFGHGTAGKLAGIPGSGRSTEIPLRNPYEPTWGGRAQPERSVDDVLQGLRNAASTRGPVHGPDSLPEFDYQGASVQPGEPVAVGGTEIGRDWTSSEDLPYDPAREVRNAEIMGQAPNIKAGQALAKLRDPMLHSYRTLSPVPGAFR